MHRHHHYRHKFVRVFQGFRFPMQAELFRSPNRAMFCMWYAGASRKSPNDAPWEILNQKLSRPISAYP